MEFQRHLSSHDLGRNMRRAAVAAALTFGLAIPSVSYAQESTQVNQSSTPTVSGKDAQGHTYTPERTYPQCGGSLNGEVFPSSHTLLVTVLKDNAGDSIFGVHDLGDLGQCSSPQRGSERIYNQCGGMVNGVKYADNHTIRIDETINEQGVNYQGMDLGAITGQCGNTNFNVPTCKGLKTWQDVDFYVPQGPWTHDQAEIDVYNKTYCK